MNETVVYGWRNMHDMANDKKMSKSVISANEVNARFGNMQ